METESFFIETIRCALHGVIPYIPPNADFHALYNIASKHNMASTVYYALKSADIDQKSLTPFFQAQAKSLSRAIIQDSEFDKIVLAFVKEKTPCLAIKGKFISSLYPSPDMRVSSDLDFLINKDDEKKSKEILESLGYNCQSYGVLGADVYYKQPIMNVEIHDVLFENDTFNGYFDNALIRGKKTETGWLRQSPEDLFIYSVAHFYKHFNLSGCGIRFVSDHYLLWNSLSKSEKEYSLNELNKIGLKKFTEKMNKLSENCFGKTAQLHELSEIELYILGSGIYGTHTNKVELEKEQIRKKHKSETVVKLIYLLHRIFPSYTKMSLVYAKVRKYPVLLPFYWIGRIFKAMFFKRDKIKSEIKD